jgi:hypothetical protein
MVQPQIQSIEVDSLLQTATYKIIDDTPTACNGNFIQA